jgi:hypothetical protein
VFAAHGATGTGLPLKDGIPNIIDAHIARE